MAPVSRGPADAHDRLGNRRLAAKLRRRTTATTDAVAEAGVELAPASTAAERLARTGEAALRGAAPLPSGPRHEPRRGGSNAALLPAGSRPLSVDERARFEPTFAVDLSAVRVHDGGQAQRAARAVAARSFALDSDIVLGERAGTGTARSAALAHELTHIVAGHTTERRLHRDPLTVAEIDARLAQIETEVGASNDPATLQALFGERGRLMQLRAQLIGGTTPDWSLASSQPPSITEAERARYYQRIAGFSSGIEVLSSIFQQLQQSIASESNELHVLSDRRFTHQVVIRMVGQGTRFADQATRFLEQSGDIDRTLAGQLLADTREFVALLQRVRQAAPAPVGGVEATLRRASGGAWGAIESFAGFLRLGLWDSWGQFFFDGSEQRIDEAQRGMMEMFDSVSQRGVFGALGHGAENWLNQIEEAENLGYHSRAGNVFGSGAFNVYFVGRGLVSVGTGIVRLSRAAQAMRALGEARPWMAAMGVAGREMMTFRGVGVHGGGGIWGSQYGMAGGGPTVRVLRVIDTEQDLIAKHWRIPEGSEHSLTPSAGEVPTNNQVIAQHIRSSTGSPYQSGLPMGDIETYALANPQNIGVIRQGRFVVVVEYPQGRGLVDANRFVAEQRGLGGEGLQEFNRPLFGLRAPRDLRPTTLEGYETWAHPPEAQAWVEANFGINHPAAVRALNGVPYYEWEQVMLAPNLRPYVVDVQANPFAGSSPAPFTGGRAPFYHPALNPQATFGLVNSTPGGWQAFRSYLQWLRTPGVGENIGFTPSEIAGFERMTVLGGGPLGLPYVGSTGPSQSSRSPATTAALLRGYLDWVQGQSPLPGDMLATAQASVDHYGGDRSRRGVPPRSLTSSEGARALAAVAARIGSMGGSVRQMRVGPENATLTARLPGGEMDVLHVLRTMGSSWTITGSYQALVTLHAPGLPATCSRFSSVSLPSSLRVRVYGPGGALVFSH